jgi:hypothetical protein
LTILNWGSEELCRIQVPVSGDVSSGLKEIESRIGIPEKRLRLHFDGNALTESATWLNSGLVSSSSLSLTIIDESDEESDRFCLMELFDACEGLRWARATNWSSPAPLSSWDGVTINHDGRVVKLELWNNNLTGQLPQCLGTLTHLAQLSITNCPLSGTIIPDNLGSLTLLSPPNVRLSCLLPRFLIKNCCS